MLSPANAEIWYDTVLGFCAEHVLADLRRDQLARSRLQPAVGELIKAVAAQSASASAGSAGRRRRPVAAHRERDQQQRRRPGRSSPSRTTGRRAVTKTCRAASAFDRPGGRAAAADLLASPNTVTSTASPSDPPTCCITFTRPDAAPGVLGGDAVEGGRGERDEGQAVAHAEHQQRPDQRQVAAVLAELGQPQHAERREGDADDHQPVRADPLDQVPRAQLRRGEHDRGERHEGEAGLEVAVAEHAAQELGEEEEHPHHPGDEQQAGDVGAAAVAVGEQPQRRDRRLGPQLGEDERREQHRPGGERADRADVAPAVGWPR